MKHENIEILTERLVLRVPTEGDAVEINNAVNEVWSELQLWMSWAFEGQQKLKSTQHYIAHIVPEQIAAGGLPLVAFCRNSGRYVASTGITPQENMPTTGYWVAKDFLGKGFATEAAIATIRYAFAAMKIPAIGIEHYEGNEKSRHIIEKLGFAPTRVTKKTKARCLDGTLLDEFFYEMRDPTMLPPLQVEWRERCP